MTSFVAPVHVFVSLRPKDPEDATAVDALQRALTTLVVESNKEPGCLYYHWYPEASDPHHYLIVEKYVDQKAVDNHNCTTHFTSLVPVLQEHATIAFIKYADQQSTTATAAATTPPPTSAVRLIVTVSVSDEVKFLSAAAALTAQSQAEEGNVQYEYARVRGGNEYIYVELWLSDAALEQHSASAHCKELIPVLDACSNVTSVCKAYETSFSAV